MCTGLRVLTCGGLAQGQHNEPVDEEGVQKAHNVAYGEGNASSLGASSLGSAAALQVRSSPITNRRPEVTGVSLYLGHEEVYLRQRWRVRLFVGPD